ncbi:iron reductase domain protein [Lentithecium fluviatile CBS 122367]|uniref:Iron reductase domain protein n=1 Tax=Lentithecium fluviatile CBS 122367 TaxID=1168545 RepID=A0A6G1IQY7_9PLEO|nr:iron reductase domain protein [Lentithecium fluviatile CBS 122367]
MRSFRRDAVAAGLLALASHTSAQTANYCPTSDVCYKLNIPDSTASSGSGDIFFQLSAPDTYQWVALGQGSSMSGSNIFVVYTAGNGNVTISPRLGTGEREPNFNSNAQVTLLEGSGVSNGKMVANVKCSSCNTWSGGSASFSDSKGNWIWAAKTGGALDTTDQSASISQHDDEAAFSWEYASAKGGSSVNPLISSSSSGTGTATGTAGVTSCVPRPVSTGGSSGASGSGTRTSTGGASTATTKTDDDDDDHRWGRPTDYSGWSAYPTARPTGESEHDKRQEINYCDDNSNSNSGVTLTSSSGKSTTEKMLIAHGTLAALAMVILFPFGAIAIRLTSFTGLVWVHAAFQGFAYLVYIVAFGLGIYVANQYDLIDEAHPIIGIVVFICLFFQPIFGFLHHSLFKKYQSRTFWSYSHIWLGRSVITLGIINGGLGFELADKMNLSSKSGMIAYSVVAGVVWLAWVAAIVIGERRRKTALANSPPKYTESPGSPRRETEERSDIPHPESGHYAPAKGA